MTERPILFSGPMVRAILEGRKTQTRRVVKPQPFNGKSDDEARAFLIEKDALGPAESLRELVNHAWSSGFIEALCPYGVPGDLLWVREQLRMHGMFGFPLGETPQVKPIQGRIWSYAADGIPDPTGSRPSIHMPRWASRITLEVTKVRIERLQEISNVDAIAEGAREFDGLEPSSHRYAQPARWSMEENRTKEAECLTSARWAFANYWEKLNAKRAPWDSNPWVWVVEFRRKA